MVRAGGPGRVQASWQAVFNSIGFYKNGGAKSQANRVMASRYPGHRLRNMKVKEAIEITGGLSKPSKMPGPAYNLPAAACLTGAKLVKVAGSTCSGCYALKGRYRFGNVQKALNRRLKALEDPRWVAGMITLIQGRPVFRWHDSGDIQSAQHLKNIFEICNATPETLHWLPTREAQFLKFLDPEVVPKLNQTIV